MAKSKYRHPKGKFAKRGKYYYGDTRKLTLKQIRAYHSRKRGK